MTDVQQRGSSAPVTFSLSGEVDIHTADAIRGAASLAVADGASSLCLDLAEVTFMDSQGLNALVGAHRALDRVGAELHLANVPAPLQRLLELTGLDRVLRFDVLSEPLA